MEINNHFCINVKGQIEQITFPLGINSSKLFCRYDIIVGPDWQILSGVNSGITQCAQSSNLNDNFVFNMPLEFMYKSTNIYGWPQIVISVYGSNWWGTECSIGYARIHIPGTNSLRKINIPLFTMKNTNFGAAITNWITSRNPELRDPKILADGNNAKGLYVESYGTIVLSMQTLIVQNTNKLK